MLVPIADQSTGTGSFISRKQSIEDYGMFLCYTLNEQKHNRCLSFASFFGFDDFDKVFSESYLIMIQFF